MRCPGCGGPLVPDELQVGVYQCAQCGEVEVDGEGAYVRGRFYALGDEVEPAEEWGGGGEGYVPTWEDVFAGEETASPFEE
jgi:hypothetical protein